MADTERSIWLEILCGKSQARQEDYLVEQLGCHAGAEEQYRRVLANCSSLRFSPRA